jgi:hypothetical protein
MGRWIEGQDKSRCQDRIAVAAWCRVNRVSNFPFLRACVSNCHVQLIEVQLFVLFRRRNLMNGRKKRPGITFVHAERKGCLWQVFKSTKLELSGPARVGGKLGTAVVASHCSDLQCHCVLRWSSVPRLACCIQFNYDPYNLAHSKPLSLLNLPPQM